MAKINFKCPECHCNTEITEYYMDARIEKSLLTIDENGNTTTKPPIITGENFLYYECSECCYTLADENRWAIAGSVELYHYLKERNMLDED